LQEHAQSDDWVLVHDAARPCVRQADIEKLMTDLAQHPIGGLLGVPVRDTMKRVDNLHIVDTINRDGLWHALTPQMFRLGNLYNALQHVLNSGELVTDESQAIEKMGKRPVLIEGHADNIKITHPQDLRLAELYLQQQ
ncbi:MAG: 2-C-methyl-D-erythritol 4-phosphate cytidylyltransferase, partial [Thiomargarita sp.]|nr:2-C-methyl-D-erythritol 4-phosphate cytidylyltransferase [Thiomargarita sp.]